MTHLKITDDNIIGRVRITCWMPKVTNTHSEYVIIIAFPLQKWLHECASILFYPTLPVLLITNTIDFYLQCQHGMARPQDADRGKASDKEGRCK